MDRPSTSVANPSSTWLYQVGGLSGLLIGLAYVAIIVLFVIAGTQPDSGQAWLEIGADKINVWWAILGFSVATDLLILPFMLALYVALQPIHRGMMLVAVAMKSLFVALELSVFWPNVGVLLTYSHDYPAASDAQQATYLALANHAATLSSQTLAGVYSILVPGLGELLIGVVVLRAAFGRVAGYAALLSGALAIFAVVAGFFYDPLAQAVIAASIFSLIFYFLAGYRLYRLRTP